MIKRKRKASIEVNKSFMPLLSSTAEGAMDVSKIDAVTGILPVPGVMQKENGTLVPAIFVHIEALTSSGDPVSHILSFHPLALASACNLMSAISLMIISDPEPLVKEIAAAEGLSTNTVPNGYL